VNVRDERAARAHVFGVDIRRKKRLANCTEISSDASNVFPAEASGLQTQIPTSHHRVFDAGAVLGVVNALRSASTRPSAGPAGIDDASARHVFSNYAMVGNLSLTRRGLTRESRRRMLTSSRRCRMALPPFAHMAYGARIGPAPTGHGIERSPQKSQSDARRPRAVRRHRLSCEPQCLSRRIILRITRCAEDAFTSGNISAGLIERMRRSNHPRSSPRGA
jgi:hypothetical protein